MIDSASPTSHDVRDYLKGVRWTGNVRPVDAETSSRVLDAYHATRRHRFQCACSELASLMIVAYDDGTWTLHRSVAEDAPTPAAIEGKRCPGCGADFSSYSLDEMTDQIWPARP